MTTTRQRILDLLTAKETASAVQISQAMHMTAANARHHLSALVSEGAVVEIGVRSGQGRGRPTKVYSLAEPVTSHNLDILAAILMNILMADRTSAEKDALLERIAADLAGEAPLTKNQTQSLYRAIQRLNGLNYRAHWEAHLSAPKIVFGHCPYAAILPEHPELCQVDALLLANMLSAPVTQTARLALAPTGLPQCVFSLQPGMKTRI